MTSKIFHGVSRNVTDKLNCPFVAFRQPTQVVIKLNCQWANLSREFCPWAATYDTALRAKVKSHACALRALGQRWLKIVWKMWRTRTLYDADLHARNQLKHGSWV